MAETRKEAPSNGTTDEKSSTRTKEIIRKRPESWSLPVSVLAMIVSAVALNYNIWADKRVRQCDFDYRAYGRLSELGRSIDKEFGTYEQYKVEFIESVMRSEDANVDLNNLIKSALDLSNKLIREFELNQVSFSNDEVDKIKLQGPKIEKQNRRSLDAVKLEVKDRELLELVNVIIETLNLMRDTVNSGLETIAQRLREFCS